LRLRINGQEAVYRIVDGGGQPTLRQVAGFPAYEGDETWSLAGISLRLVSRAPERRANRKQ
jgi:hypothetical protein